jgi:hypothetical protein
LPSLTAEQRDRADLAERVEALVAELDELTQDYGARSNGSEPKIARTPAS